MKRILALAVVVFFIFSGSSFAELIDQKQVLADKMEEMNCGGQLSYGFQNIYWDESFTTPNDFVPLHLLKKADGACLITLGPGEIAFMGQYVNPQDSSDVFIWVRG